MPGALHRLAGWLLAFVVLLWRVSCRRTVRDDPRPALRAAGRPYAYALLHAHQVAAVLVNDDPGIAAMVSRSRDGDLLVPALRVTGVAAMRGSSRRRGRDKGGREALAELIAHTRGGRPALIAVDGPQGPRNRVHYGIVHLARQADAVILPVAIVPSRRWILRRAWDRFQIPQPFCRLTMTFGAPLDPRDDPSDARVRDAVTAALAALERRCDPEEAARAQPAVAGTARGDAAARLP